MTWIGLICIGMGVGRLRRRHTNPRLLLVVTGASTVLFVSTVSALLANRFNGYAAIMDAFPNASEHEGHNFMVFGPAGPLPTEGTGWLVVAGPQTNTPFSLAIGAGFSLLCIGIFIMIGLWPKLLAPMVDRGRMPMTLYVSHLIFLTVVPDGIAQVWLFIVQFFAPVGVARLWLMVARRGPIEAATSGMVMTSQELPASLQQPCRRDSLRPRRRSSFVARSRQTDSSNVPDRVLLSSPARLSGAAR